MSRQTHLRQTSRRDLNRKRGYVGLFFDEFDPGSAWIRESAELRFPFSGSGGQAIIHGEYLPHPSVSGRETGCPGLVAQAGTGTPAQIQPLHPGAFKLSVPFGSGENLLKLQLTGVGFTNALAWCGRVTGLGSCQRFRAQNKNRQLRIRRVELDGETVFDFSDRHSPLNLTLVRRGLTTGLNVVGYLTADLGIGESARCMVSAADAAAIPVALVDLKLPVKSPRTDKRYAARLQDSNPQPVNVIHLDPPGAADIEHHHGASFLESRYNVGYWAWELPEFPTSWTPYFAWFDEIWCPSDFVREAISIKSPVPVLTMPHAISFDRPAQDAAALRQRLGLPPDRFLFLFIYDLNSYSARKNPRAVLEAFRLAGLAKGGASLVIKTHGAKGNETELAALRAAVTDLPDTTLITETLPRRDLYALQAACDCFVSLHRSEGFGLSVAECMYLGKPVIATDWSATAEYLNATNGAPVRASLVELTQNIGPYSRGQIWAEPDPAHAAEWMVRIHGDAQLRNRLGATARATIEKRFAPAVIGAAYRRRLEAIALR